MSYLHYQHHLLYIEKVSLQTIAAQYGTPSYVYSKAAILANWRQFDEALKAIPHRICYAVKANSNIAILNLLAQQNAGFDIVSLGELERVLKAGGLPNKIVFSGVGKTKQEMAAAIQYGIHCFNIESIPELNRLETIAASLNKTVNISLRINPDVDPKTHAHISTGLKENKFGIHHADILPLCEKLRSFPHLNLIGIACHIGSQITELEPFAQAIDQLITLYHQLQRMGFHLQHINVGGGLGIIYHQEKPPRIQEYITMLQEKFAGLMVEMIIEPGRAIVGNAGVLLTTVEYLKGNHHKQFAIVDAGMNDLIRPALYDAWQAILPVEKKDIPAKTYDIVGPVCESADILGKNRALSIEAGDLLVVDAAGAYGFSMHSQYNSRCSAAEILVDDDKTYLIRRRETIPELFALETIPTFT